MRDNPIQCLSEDFEVLPELIGAYPVGPPCTSVRQGRAFTML